MLDGKVSDFIMVNRSIVSVTRCITVITRRNEPLKIEQKKEKIKPLAIVKIDFQPILGTQL